MKHNEENNNLHQKYKLNTQTIIAESDFKISQIKQAHVADLEQGWFIIINPTQRP